MTCYPTNYSNVTMNEFCNEYLAELRKDVVPKYIQSLLERLHDGTASIEQFAAKTVETGENVHRWGWV